MDETKETMKKLNGSNYELPNEPPKMVAPALATAENINKAKNIVSHLQASGGKIAELVEVPSTSTYKKKYLGLIDTNDAKMRCRHVAGM